MSCKGYGVAHSFIIICLKFLDFYFSEIDNFQNHFKTIPKNYLKFQTISDFECKIRNIFIFLIIWGYKKWYISSTDARILMKFET